jgi:hypothetical protein
MTVEDWPLAQILPYERNPRKRSKAAVEKVAASIREFGWRQPIVVDERGVILVGHTRRDAAAQLGLATAPVHQALGLSEQQKTAYRIADNRTNEVAYVWHASLFTREVLDGLLRIGFVHHQQIIWDKGRTVLTRTHYWFQHEPCWYVRKKNAPWYGKAGENSTIWASPSPKFIMGGSDEDKFDHPTQKPVELMRKPILNHTESGAAVYEPFLGSGTTLVACETEGRRCYGLEIEPRYCDVIVGRWEKFTGQKARRENQA